ncbi:metallo-beta-lactamase [Bacillus toyonensis]|nr:metallo-beta-lactamase [Bacillus sp. COPE52]OTX35515.1 metallo-beta-lactamase [Bacillus thuringiensis serovar malayensis]PDY93343.1 metallo-beta-lactamase [Bacillus toyonensis]PGE67163.1 metallo-beta-lactamase [Bacillus toyonensis]PHD32893.1 metallo-beta-lactamase [Bacillus toyonensis]
MSLLISVWERYEIQLMDRFKKLILLIDEMDKSLLKYEV